MLLAAAKTRPESGLSLKKYAGGGMGGGRHVRPNVRGSVSLKNLARVENSPKHSLPSVACQANTAA